MTTTDDGFQAETWTYAGVRDDQGKRTHAWISPEDGKTRYWPDRASYVPGGLYELLIKREPGHTYRRGDPQFIEAGDDTDATAGYEILHEQADRKLRRAAAEKRAKRDGGVLDAACAPVCRVAAKVKSYDELEVLISSVRRRLIDAWDKA